MIGATLWSWASLASVGVGVASGVLSALAGVGGAVVTTPGLRALDASPTIALGSTVPAIIPSAITGSIRYRAAGLIDGRVAAWCGGVGAVSALAGAWTSTTVDARWLMVVTALLMLWSALTVLRRAFARPSEPVPPSDLPEDGAADLPGSAGPDRPFGATERSIPSRGTGEEVDHPAGLLAGIGLVAGFVAGLLGVGGGIVMVPAFTLLLKLPTKATVATSLVAVALMSTTSLIGHWMAGHIDWTLAVPLMVGVIPGARLGSKFTVVASERVMSLTCGGLLLVMGAIYLARELGGVL